MIRNTRYYTAVEYLTRNHTYRALLPLLLFSTGDVAAAAAPVRHRAPDGKNVCWFNESESIKCFLSLQRLYVSKVYTPGQYCRNYGFDLSVLYPRQLRTCA